MGLESSSGRRTIVVAVACAKGGTAKTTTVIMLAQSLALKGATVRVLDADNTGGATQWAIMARDAGMPLPFSVEPCNRATLTRGALTAMGVDWVLVDAPPSDTGMIQTAVDCADLTVIPTQSGEADLRLAGATYASAHGRGVALLTRVKPLTRLTRLAVESLDAARVARFDTMIPERERIRRAYGSRGTDASYSELAVELSDYVRQSGLKED